MTNNPFEEFKRKREAEEDAMHKAEQELEEQERRKAEIQKKRDEQKERFNPMVVEVLRLLRNAVYPTANIDRELSYSWSIQTYFNNESGGHFADYVKVEPVYNKQNGVECFVCTVNIWDFDVGVERVVASNSSRSPLDRDSLINTLTQLERWKAAEEKKPNPGQKKGLFGRLFG